MTYALDHVFVCCAEGAPEAQRLARLGLSEGSEVTAVIKASDVILATN